MILLIKSIPFYEWVLNLDHTFYIPPSAIRCYRSHSSISSEFKMEGSSGSRFTVRVAGYIYYRSIFDLIIFFPLSFRLFQSLPTVGKPSTIGHTAPWIPPFTLYWIRIIIIIIMIIIIIILYPTNCYFDPPQSYLRTVILTTARGTQQRQQRGGTTWNGRRPNNGYGSEIYYRIGWKIIIMVIRYFVSES